MSELAETNMRERWERSHPGVQTGAVFALVAALTLLAPGGLMDRVLDATGLSALLPPLAPPLGLNGRLAIAVAAGLVVALAYALWQWALERRRFARGTVLAIETDDPLTVRPLAASRELGARFDESPYLDPAPAAPPPTPDARLDPDSTLADPRWQVRQHDGLMDQPVAADPLGEDPLTTDEVPLIDRGEGWDREAPEPEDEWVPVVAHDDPVPQPGNAAAQWDGEPEEDELSVAPAALQEEPVALPEPEAESPLSEEALAATIDSSEDRELPSTEELLDRLSRAAVARGPGAGTARRAPDPLTGNAAVDLANALAALRRLD